MIYRQNVLAYLASKGLKPSFTLNCALKRANDLNMISAQHSNNNGKNLSYQKKPHSMVIFVIKVRRSYRDLSSQADPARDN